MEKTVIEQCMKGLQDSFNTFVLDNKEDNNKILEQTTKTNGNVRDLQLWKATASAQLKMMKYIVTGIIIPLAFLLVDKLIK